MFNTGNAHYAAGHRTRTPKRVREHRRPQGGVAVRARSGMLDFMAHTTARPTWVDAMCQTFTNHNIEEDTTMTNANTTNLRPFFANIDSPEKDGLFNDPLAFVQRVLDYPDLPAVLAVGYAGGMGNTYPGVADVPVPLRNIVADLTTFHLRRENGGPMRFARHADGTWLDILYPDPYRNDEGLKCVKSCYVVIYYDGNEDTPASVLERNRRMWRELDLPCDEFQTGHCVVEELTDDAGDSRRIVVW